MVQKRAILLRGVNVGGGNKVPMAELRALCARLGWTDVATYIASGNLVFRSEDPDPGARLRAAMADRMGVDVACPVLTADQVRAARDDCPFPTNPGNRCHAFFLWKDPVVDNALRDSLIAPDEGLAVAGRVAWLHTPSGFGVSKIAGKIDKVLGTSAITARNMNTVARLIEMLDG